MLTLWSLQIWHWCYKNECLRSIILLLTVPSERTAPAHLLPSYSGMGQTRETARPLQGAGEAVLPQGRLRSAEQRRMCIRVHVVLHADGLLSQHIRQSSGTSVMGRDAWHAAGRGVAKSWTQLSDRTGLMVQISFLKILNKKVKISFIHGLSTGLG